MSDPFSGTPKQFGGAGLIARGVPNIAGQKHGQIQFHDLTCQWFSASTPCLTPAKKLIICNKTAEEYEVR